MKREASTSVVTLLGNVHQIPNTADAPLSGIWCTYSVSVTYQLYSRLAFRCASGAPSDTECMAIRKPKALINHYPDTAH